jgi:hypothetical protein
MLTRIIFTLFIVFSAFSAFCQGTDNATQADAEESGLVILAKDTLFRRLLADPKYPRFSASYQYYSSGADNYNTFKGAFGRPFSVIRGETEGGMRWETGINAGVFSTFDLDINDFNMINADYWVGIPLTFQKGDHTLMFRIYHQSSHLGDEYMIFHPRVKRVNLSYEVVDFLLSYDLSEHVRLYGGMGYRISGEPSGFGRVLYQAGAEFRADSFRFPLVLAADFQSGEEWDYEPAISIVGGVELTPVVYITLDYYNGHSDNGQFYVNDVERYGISLRLYY